MMAPITKLVYEQNNKEVIPVIRIKEVKKDTLKEFFRIPWKVYQNNPFWVPPFWSEFKEFFKQDNPFWNHSEKKLYISYKNDEPVGRIAAIIDHRYCQYQKKKIGFFGFFECINDFEVANELFSEAEKWLSSKEMTIMQGPIDGRVDNGCGFLYQGFNHLPSLLSTYSQKYYLSFAKKYGLKKSRDQITYYIDLTKPLPHQLKEKAEQCRSDGFSIRQFKRFRTKKELAWWVDLFLDTFSDHWGYVPVSPEEVTKRFGVKQLQWFVDTDFFLIAEYNNKPVAYLWAIPEYNQLFHSMNGKLDFPQLLKFLWKRSNITKGKLHLIGVKEKFRGKQIASLLNYEALRKMKDEGYVGAEIGWVDEKNKDAHKIIKITEAEILKKHRVFEKHILI